MVQARYFMLTAPEEVFEPHLPDGVEYIRGQKEVGASGYRHWQLVVYFKKPTRLKTIKQTFGEKVHAEPTNSKAALDYVWKDDTAVLGTRFELGKISTKRNSSKDWDDIWQKAKDGKMDEIPADVRIRSYHTFKRIRKDYQDAPFREGIITKVFWGPTGTGKSHRMFTESYAPTDNEPCATAPDGFRMPYVKNSTTKWWDGYQGQPRVIIDEFRGQIAIEHMLKWLDKYPCFVEEKGGQIALLATEFWICSNLHPSDWYPTLDDVTKDALLRRLEVIHMSERDLSRTDEDVTGDVIESLVLPTKIDGSRLTPYLKSLWE